MITSLCCSNFVYFYVYNSLKAVLIEQGKTSNPVKDLLLAYIAGIVIFFFSVTTSKRLTIF